jgi:hypothetical protein
MNIYLDMDDVVADWVPYAQEFIGLRWDVIAGERIPQDEWDKLKEDYRFYSKLPIKPGAHELVDYCRSYVARNPGTNLAFLTALPHDYSGQYASWDKCWWANKHFPGIPVFFGPFSHDKWRHCKHGDILIDDRHSNCHEWRAAGGLSHEYRNWPDCKVWLESVLQAPASV